MKEKLYKLSEYQLNNENPFLKQAIEQVQQNVVKRFKTASKTGEKAVLKAVDDDNNILGHTSFIRQIEVDEEKFAKIYLSNFASFFDLKPAALKVFGYILNQLVPNKDEFYFMLNDCMEYTQYKTKGSIFMGLGQLVENQIIARGKTDFHYYINPMVVFNGNRLTFANTYIKKKTKNNPPKNIGSFNFDNPEDPYLLPTMERGEAFDPKSE